jgi:glycosyltransferase involved in cell wall biosynthesis
MKIGFFSPTINAIGGGELVTLNMIRALEKRNHEILIYTSQKIDQRNIQKFLGNKIQFDHEVKIGPSFSNPYSLENIYPNMLRSFLFRKQCDLLIDTFSDVIFPWSDAIYFQKNIRTDRLPNNPKGSLFSPYKTFLTSYIRKIGFSNKILMTSSKFAAKNIEASIGQPINVLYPPVSAFFKFRNDILTKNNTVVAVTRISQDKRPETIPYIAKLSQKNLVFIIIGSCRTSSDLISLNILKEQIRKLDIASKVKLFINISREKQIVLLQKAKFYLHPFVQFESFGVSAAEAMMAGCIPIVPNVGGLKEIVPRQLRYNSVDEAAILLNELSTNWSPPKVQQSIKMAERFSQEKFCEEFLRMMKL